MGCTESVHDRKSRSRESAMYHHKRQPRDPIYARPPVQPTWPETSHYAPNYPIYPFEAAPTPAPRVTHSLAPFPAVFVPRFLERFERTSQPPRPIQPQLRRKISIPKKQVHFNLPSRSPTHRHAPRTPSQVSPGLAYPMPPKD